VRSAPTAADRTDGSRRPTTPVVVADPHSRRYAHRTASNPVRGTSKPEAPVLCSLHNRPVVAHGGVTTYTYNERLSPLRVLSRER
jgi:hypothetical protein